MKPGLMKRDALHCPRPSCMSMPGRDCITNTGGIAAVHVAGIESAASIDSRRKTESGCK
jgi:hypothetical protein